MSENFYEKARELGHEYWVAREKLENFKDKESEFKEFQKPIQELEAQLVKFKEGSTMRHRIEEQIEQIKRQEEEIGTAEKKFSIAEKEILQLTADLFEIDPKGEKKLDKDYIRAINHLLLDDPKEIMEFDECIISPEAVTISENKVRAMIVCVNICNFVRMAASDKLREEKGLLELWDHISHAKTMFTVFSVLAKTKIVMTADEIFTKIQEPEWNVEKVRNNLNNLLRDHIFTHKLILRAEKGKFKVSDIGEHLWREFGPKEEETTNMSPDPQRVLNEWAER